MAWDAIGQLESGQTVYLNTTTRVVAIEEAWRWLRDPTEDEHREIMSKLWTEPESVVEW